MGSKLGLAIGIGVSMLMGLTGCQKAEKPQEIIFWTSEVEQDRMEVQNRLAERFASTNPGLTVKVVPVDENVLPEKLAAAKAANELPDVLELGLSQVAQYGGEGILDDSAATVVVNDVGKADFFDGPLQLCRIPGGEGYAAVPVDGWVQGIWYRKDWFQEEGLEAPDDWEAIRRAARTFQAPEKSRFGIVVGTHPEQMYTQQVFEQIALSAGARLYKPDGSFAGDSDEMRAAFAFYGELAAHGCFSS